MKVRRTKIVITPDDYPYRRNFDLNVPVSEYCDITFYRPLTPKIARTSWKEEWPKIGAVGQKLALAIMNIAGVEELRLRTYCLEVQIGQAFDWSTDWRIESSVLDVIIKVLNCEEPPEIIGQDAVTVAQNARAHEMIKTVEQKPNLRKPAQRRPAAPRNPNRVQQNDNSK